MWTSSRNEYLISLRSWLLMFPLVSRQRYHSYMGVKFKLKSPVGLKNSSISLKIKGQFKFLHLLLTLFFLSLLYHRRFIASCDFICWASESNCQSFCADEQLSGWKKAVQQEPLNPSALGPLAEIVGDPTMDRLDTALLWALRGFKWLCLQILWVAKWSTSIFCSLNNDTWPLGPMMGFHFLPCQLQRILL